MSVKEGHVEYDFGHCSWSFEEDYVHIYILFVKKSRRGKGHARFLLQRAIEDIRKAGYMEKISIVADPSDSSVDKIKLANFYVRMGFKVFEYYG